MKDKSIERYVIKSIDKNDYFLLKNNSHCIVLETISFLNNNASYKLMKFKSEKMAKNQISPGLIKKFGQLKITKIKISYEEIK